MGGVGATRAGFGLRGATLALGATPSDALGAGTSSGTDAVGTTTMAGVADAASAPPDAAGVAFVPESTAPSFRPPAARATSPTTSSASFDGGSGAEGSISGAGNTVREDTPSPLQVPDRPSQGRVRQSIGS